MDQLELEQKLTTMETQLSDAVAKVDTLEAIAKAYRELETTDRDTFATLSHEEQEEFVKADDERKGELLHKSKPEPDELPEPIRKRLEEVEKRAKEAEAKNLELAQQIAKANDEKLTAAMIAKAEAEFPNLPGTPNEKGSVLKSLHCPCLDDGQREAIFKLFRAGNEAVGKLTHSVGTDAATDAALSKGWAAVEKRAVAWAQETGRKVSKEVAVTDYLGTVEGAQAYTKYLEQDGKK